MAAQNTHNQQHQTHKAGKQNAVLLEAHDQAHEHGDRHGDDNDKQRPGRVVHGADAGQRKTGQGQNKNTQHGDARHGACNGADLALGDGRKALALVPDGGEQHHHIVHRAAKYAANQNPQRAGQIAELRGEHRANQRPCSRDGGKMVAVENKFVGFDVVVTISKTNRWRNAARIQFQNLVCQKNAIHPVGNGKYAQCRKH